MYMLTSCNASPKSSRTQVGEPDRSLDRHIKQTHESTASKSTMRKVRQVPIHMLAKRLSSGKGRVRRGREEGGETPRMTRNDGIELFPTERLLDMLRTLAPNHVQERFNASSSICTCHIVTSTYPRRPSTSLLYSDQAHLQAANCSGSHYYSQTPR